MAEERLQKLLARAGVASRRKAEELIAAGLVTINGRVASLGDKADEARDAIKVEGRRLPPAVPHRYVVLNKPAGYVSTVADPERRPTVLDLVHPALRKALVPVGRLDFQSEGLILLTTDGEWAQRIAHPRYGCAKVYEAKVKGLPEEREVERLRRGMWIEGKRTLPAEVRLLRTTGRGRESGNSWWEVVLREGRSRQIREMFFRVGHGVLKLRRVAIGPLRDTDLPLGAWRELAEEEVERLRKAGKTSAKLQGRRLEEAPPPSGRPRRKAQAARDAYRAKGGSRTNAAASPGTARIRRVPAGQLESAAKPAPGSRPARRKPARGRPPSGEPVQGQPGGAGKGTPVKGERVKAKRPGRPGGGGRKPPGGGRRR